MAGHTLSTAGTVAQLTPATYDLILRRIEHKVITMQEAIDASRWRSMLRGRGHAAQQTPTRGSTRMTNGTTAIGLRGVAPRRARHGLTRPWAIPSLLLAGGLIAAACGGSAVAATVPPHAKTDSVLRGGVVRLAQLPGEPPNMIYPVFEGPYDSFGNIGEFQTLMYQPLFQASVTSESINYADSIGNRPVWSDHDRVLTITLKHYKWSNGSAVTTQDIAFDIALLKAAGTSYGNYIPGDFPYNVAKTTVISPYKISFTLTGSYNPTYFDDNQLIDITPLPQNVWDRESLDGPVGNFSRTPAGAKAVQRFLVSYAAKTSTYSMTNKIWGDVDGAYLLAQYGGNASTTKFIPNPHYSGHKSLISAFEEVPFDSTTAEYDELRIGTSAITIADVPHSDIPTLAAVRANGYKIVKSPDFGMGYLVPNFDNPTAGPLFHQLYIRQVLEHLVDQPLMIHAFLHGYGTPSYGPIPLWPPNNSWLTTYQKVNHYPFSLTAARSLLSQHGWKLIRGIETCVAPSRCGKGIARGTQFKMQLLYASGSNSTTEESELFSSDAAKIGVIVDLKTESPNAVNASIFSCTPGRNGVTTKSSACAWQLSNYGGWGYNGVFPSGGILAPTSSYNNGSYVYPALDRLITAIHHSPTLSAFFAYENLAAQQLPWIWWPSADQVVAVATRLHAPGVDNAFGGDPNMLEPNYWYFTK